MTSTSPAAPPPASRRRRPRPAPRGARRARRACSICARRRLSAGLHRRHDSSAGDEAARIVTSVIVNNFKRSVFLRPIEPGGFPEQVRPRRPRQISISSARSTRNMWSPAARSAAPDGRLKTEFRLFDVTTGEQAAGQQYVTDSANIAPRRASRLGRGVLAHHRREGLFRHARRLRRRERAQGAAPQAARHHGSGRRQCALSDARRRTRRHAALLALLAGRHLYVLRRRRSEGAAAQHRERPARGGRQFSGHDLLAALLAGRAEDRDVAVAGRRDQSLRHGPALAHDDAAHRHQRHRHLALLFAERRRRSCSNPIAAARSRSM